MVIVADDGTVTFSAAGQADIATLRGIAGTLPVPKTWHAIAAIVAEDRASIQGAPAH